MKVAMSWFNDYTDISDITPKQFADDMTMSGTKVEGIESRGEEIKNVVCGKVLSVEKHENADSLFVCKVDVKDEVLQIVTGATNLFEGCIVPVAKHGAHLAGGITIKKGKLRGVESHGMMCSHDELGLTPADLGYEPEYGILILKPDTKIGADIKEVLSMKENIVEFEVTSNRPDCQSVIGLAREAAVTFDRELKLKEPKPDCNSEDIADYVKVDVLDKNYCKRYTAKMVKNVKVAPSPAWLVKRLEASGIRSINNIVDITNYILLEYGQPMHAFDLRHLSGNHIIVRRADDGEVITTLDDAERKLDSSMLVIADEEKAVAVAGVMGGLNSEIKEDTTTILFESANFDGASVRVTAKNLGLRTESSAKYEKGLDPENTLPAVLRACELICELGAGEVVGGILDVKGEMPKNRVLKFRPDKINKFLGAEISFDFMVKTLSRLGFTVDADSMTVKVPSYRPDVEGEADLAEEVVRIYGYNNIKSTLTAGELTKGGKNKRQMYEDSVKNILTAQGLNEILTYSFTSPTVFDRLCLENNSELKNAIRISNPLGEENSVMRTTLLGSMLEVLSRNFNQRNEEAGLFELGKIYFSANNRELPDEKDAVSIGMYGENIDFYVIKGVIEELFYVLGIKEYEFASNTENPTFHPGRCADILINGKMAGVVGQVNSRVIDNFDIETNTFIAQIDFNSLMDGSVKKIYKKLPKFPATLRDIAMIVDENILVAEIEAVIKKSAGKILDSVKLFDVYKGKQVPEGKKSVAYSVALRSEEKTLSEQEINKVMNKIIKNLEVNLGAQLR